MINDALLSIYPMVNCYLTTLLFWTKMANHYQRAGHKCKECKYKCHRDCASKVPPSCKLPPEYLDYFRHHMGDGSSTPNLQRPAGGGNNVGSSMVSVPSPSLTRLTPQDKKKSRTQPTMHMTQGMCKLYVTCTSISFYF